MAYNSKNLVKRDNFIKVFNEKRKKLNSNINQAMTVLEGIRLTKGEKPYNLKINPKENYDNLRNK
jgi:hypothetical protein